MLLWLVVGTVLCDRWMPALSPRQTLRSRCAFCCGLLRFRQKARTNKSVKNEKHVWLEKKNKKGQKLLCFLEKKRKTMAWSIWEANHMSRHSSNTYAMLARGSGTSHIPLLSCSPHPIFPSKTDRKTSGRKEVADVMAGERKHANPLYLLLLLLYMPGFCFSSSVSPCALQTVNGEVGNGMLEACTFDQWWRQKKRQAGRRSSMACARRKAEGKRPGSWPWRRLKAEKKRPVVIIHLSSLSISGGWRGWGEGEEAPWQHLFAPFWHW